MKTIPGIQMRSGIDKPTDVVCNACNRVGYVLPAGDQLTIAGKGVPRTVKCSKCKTEIHLHVIPGAPEPKAKQENGNG